MYIFAAKIIHVRTRDEHRTSSRLPRNCSQLPKEDVSGKSMAPAKTSEITAVVDKVCEYVHEHYTWYYPFAELQRLTGCRVSEAFNLKLWRINDAGRYTLQPNKGNNMRIFPPEWTEYIEALRVWASTWASQYVSESNYRRIIRHAFRSFGLVHLSPAGFTLSGCHTFRHAYVKRMLEYNPTWEELLRNTGEVTRKALSQYVNSKYFIMETNTKI